MCKSFSYSFLSFSIFISITIVGFQRNEAKACSVPVLKIIFENNFFENTNNIMLVLFENSSCFLDLGQAWLR